MHNIVMPIIIRDLYDGSGKMGFDPSPSVVASIRKSVTMDKRGDIDSIDWSKLSDKESMDVKRELHLLRSNVLTQLEKGSLPELMKKGGMHALFAQFSHVPLVMIRGIMANTANREGMAGLAGLIALSGLAGMTITMLRDELANQTATIGMNKYDREEYLKEKHEKMLDAGSLGTRALRYNAGLGFLSMAEGYVSTVSRPEAANFEDLAPTLSIGMRFFNGSLNTIKEGYKAAESGNIGSMPAIAAKNMFGDTVNINKHVVFGLIASPMNRVFKEVRTDTLADYREQNELDD